MHVIKGLITKDILQLKSYKKTLIIFIMVEMWVIKNIQIYLTEQKLLRKN